MTIRSEPTSFAYNQTGWGFLWKLQLVAVFPRGFFLLERKKNRAACTVFTVLFGEMFQKSVYFSWLLLLSVAPPFNGTFFHPFFTPLFSCPSSSIPTYGTDWLTESLMIHHAERSTRQRASGQITSNFQFRESCIYQTDFTLALSQKYHFWDLLWLV